MTARGRSRRWRRSYVRCSPPWITLVDKLLREVPELRLQEAKRVGFVAGQLAVDQGPGITFVCTDRGRTEDHRVLLPDVRRVGRERRALGRQWPGDRLADQRGHLRV